VELVKNSSTLWLSEFPKSRPLRKSEYGNSTVYRVQHLLCPQGLQNAGLRGIGAASVSLVGGIPLSGFPP
jgi:hypothetical protein